MVTIKPGTLLQPTEFFNKIFSFDQNWLLLWLSHIFLIAPVMLLRLRVIRLLFIINF